MCNIFQINEMFDFWIIKVEYKKILFDVNKKSFAVNIINYIIKEVFCDVPNPF